MSPTTPDPIGQLSEIVNRLITNTQTQIQDLTNNDRKLTEKVDRLVDSQLHTDQRIRQLVDVQLSTQAQVGSLSQQLGFLSQMVVEIREETRQLKAGYDQQQAVLNELIRQRRPPSDV